MNKNLPKKWLERAQDEGYKEAMLIQKRSFEALSENQDVVGISPTGSGKTLAYLLPLLLKVRPGQGNQLLILTSSQELGMQVNHVATAWAGDIGLKVQALIGGANVNRQIDKLKEKPEVLVGTVGRVLELIQKKKVKAHHLQAIVFDEADQLLQGDTSKMVSELIKTFPNESQYGFYSATAEAVLPQIETLLSKKVRVIDVSKEDQSQGEIKHYYLKVSARKTVDTLRRLGNISGFQALVFFNQVADLGSAEEKLHFHKLPVASVTSDQSKEKRRLALEKFRQGALVELLSTDVSSRGLDIANLPFVINCEVPLTKESYLHRAGRVGRMGASGQVITFIQENTLGDLKKMTRQLDIELQEVYLYAGKLSTQAPEKISDEFKSVEKKKPVSTFEIKKKSHKKGRHRNQKNKGARKKKDQ